MIIGSSSSMEMGEPNLYQLKMSFSIHGRDSDSVERSFGIREVTSQLDSNDHRLFLINGDGRTQSLSAENELLDPREGLRQCREIVRHTRGNFATGFQ